MLKKDGIENDQYCSSDDNVRHHSVAVQHQVNFTVKAYTEQDGILKWPNDKWQAEIIQ